MFDSILIPLHRDGWKFVALFALVTLGLFFLWQPLGWLGVVLSCWCAYFFRDPPRVADPSGRTGCSVRRMGGLGGPACRAPAGDRPGQAALTRISIFMNVFNVHVNRSPAEGEVAALAYRPGVFSMPRWTRPASSMSGWVCA